MRLRSAVVLLLLSSGLAKSQTNAASAGDMLLERAMQGSELTYKGSPFHAVLQIAPGARRDGVSAGSSYSGAVEVWWSSDGNYRLVAKTPEFSMEEVVVDGRLEQTHTGNYYPRWLETFVQAIVGLVPVEMFRSEKGASLSGGETLPGGFATRRCVSRDDRTNGITDRLTWGSVCFVMDQPLIESVQTFNYTVFLKDIEPFGGKQVAREYDVNVLDYLPVIGRMTTLEPLSAGDAAKSKSMALPKDSGPILTSFVSTLQEESMVETAPQIEWPAVREGKTEGYMIVYARTDTTGQVRETAKHNSDNPGLESFGMGQALRFKFKPLVVNGVAEQMEMPLVLHFVSRIDNPIPVLTEDQMKLQTIKCKPEEVPSGILEKGERAVVRVSVDETGKIAGTQPVSKAPWGKMLREWQSVQTNCQFKPYLLNGKPTYYKGDVALKVRP